MTNETNKPVVSNRDKLLSVSVFPHTDDQGRTTYGASLQRAYQKPEQKGSDNFERQKINLYPDELLRIAALCERTYNDILIYAQINKQQSTGSHPAQTMDVDNAPEPVADDTIPF
jgi:hypothetical protein